MVRTRPSTNQHRVYMLGAFHIEYKEQSIRLPTRKTESLLAYLILHPDPHSREKLASLFWGDSSDSAARGSLRKALTHLRKNINRDIVLSDRENVQLNPSFPLWVDVLHIENLAKELLSDVSPDLNRFIEITYQGDLLSGLYDDWVLPLREHYRKLYLDVMLHGVERARAQSEYKFAIEFAQNILVIDIARERAHQHLMFCYVTLGDRNKALRQYDACQRALQDELAVEPARETRALYEWIKQTASDVPSMAARVTNLPIPISSFVGRNRELSKIKQLLSDERLVTLTGAGGSGKTRLAIHAATDLIDSFKDGVWWIELAPLIEPALIPSAVAKALGIDNRSDQPLTETLKQYLYNKKLLLVLDNCEHLIEACAHLAEFLLISCADLKILATSREALSLTGENVWPVPPLSLPEGQITLLALLMQYESVHLFVERASSVNPEFTPDDENAVAITQICQWLDGIPLAIELAAARVRNMSIEQISAGLDDTFQLLAGSNRTANLRHQTLRAAIDWSYELLSDAERQLFCRLSIFSGGWTLEAAETVCSGKGIEKKDIPNLLARLVDKSLVTTHTEGQRYGMLETLRQYGSEKLAEKDELDWIIERHLDYYLNMARIGDEKIRGPEQIAWLRWFYIEGDNLTNAMEMGMKSYVTLEKGCELVCATCWYWGIVGDFNIMKYWLEIAVSQSAGLGKTSLRAKLLFNSGFFSVWGMTWLEPEKAQAEIEACIDIFDVLGESYTIERARCLMVLGYIRKSYYNDDKGYAYLDQAVSIFREKSENWWLAFTLSFYGMIMVWDYKDFDVTRKLLEEEVTLWNQVGDRKGLGYPLEDFGSLHLREGDFVKAREYYQESLQIAYEFKARANILEALQFLGQTARGLKDYEQATLYYEESLLLSQEIGWDNWLFSIHCGLGYSAIHMGNEQGAVDHFCKAYKYALDHDFYRGRILCIAGYASLVTHNKPIVAAKLFGAFFAQIEELQKESKSKKKLIISVDQMEIDEYLAYCHSQLEDTMFDEMFNVGRTLSLNDVVKEISKIFGNIFVEQQKQLRKRDQK
jgi:predicted ATPase/DNA-binding SARP family transcriptional activator